MEWRVIPTYQPFHAALFDGDQLVHTHPIPFDSRRDAERAVDRLNATRTPQELRAGSTSEQEAGEPVTGSASEPVTLVPSAQRLVTTDITADGPTGGIVPPYIHDAIQDAADRVVRGDRLETTDGILDTAVIGMVTATRTGEVGVMLSIEVPQQNVVTATVLNRAEVLALIHALQTSVWPYGEQPDLNPGPVKHRRR